MTNDLETAQTEAQVSILRYLDRGHSLGEAAEEFDMTLPQVEGIVNRYQLPATEGDSTDDDQNEDTGITGKDEPEGEGSRLSVLPRYRDLSLRTRYILSLIHAYPEKSMTELAGKVSVSASILYDNTAGLRAHSDNMALDDIAEYYAPFGEELRKPSSYIDAERRRISFKFPNQLKQDLQQIKDARGSVTWREVFLDAYYGMDMGLPHTYSEYKLHSEGMSGVEITGIPESRYNDLLQAKKKDGGTWGELFGQLVCPENETSLNLPIELETISKEKKTPVTEVVRDIQRVWEALGDSPTAPEYNEHGRYHASTLTTNRKWNELRRLAGVDVLTQYSVKDLFEEYNRLCDKHGKRLTSKEVREYDFPYSAVYNQFDDWDSFLRANPDVEKESSDIELGKDDTVYTTQNGDRWHVSEECATNRSERVQETKLRFVPFYEPCAYCSEDVVIVSDKE